MGVLKTRFSFVCLLKKKHKKRRDGEMMLIKLLTCPWDQRSCQLG